MGKITQIKVNCDLIYEAGVEAGGGTGGEDMIVNLTKNNDTITADKTFDEIYNAINSGKMVYARLYPPLEHGGIMNIPCNCFSQSTIHFQSTAIGLLASNTAIIIVYESNGTITVECY